MNELNIAHHLSMGFNFENKQHIGWKIYLNKQYNFQNENSFLRRLFYHLLLCLLDFLSGMAVYILSKWFKDFFFLFPSCKYFLSLEDFPHLLIFSSLSLLPNCYSTSALGPLVTFILMKILGMLPSVSNWGCLYFYCICWFFFLFMSFGQLEQIFAFLMYHSWKRTFWDLGELRYICFPRDPQCLLLLAS